MSNLLSSTPPEEYLEEFLQHANTMYHFALKLTNNGEDAQDLVQDTFLRAFRYYDHYKPGTNSRSWLFKLMYNLFINNYRRKQNSPLIELDEERSHNPYYDQPIKPEVFKNSFSDEVMLAFNRLKPELKSALFLRDFEGLKYNEISKVLNIPVYTVKTRIHRARTLMRKSLVKSGVYRRNNKKLS